MSSFEERELHQIERAWMASLRHDGHTPGAWKSRRLSRRTLICLVADC